MSRQNLEVYRGIGFNMSYTHVEPMTGGTVYFTVKANKYDTDAADTTGVPKATVTTFTNAGLKGSWTITDASMYIEPGKYYYDIIFEPSSGPSLPPIFEGEFKVLPHATNRNTVNG